MQPMKTHGKMKPILEMLWNFFENIKEGPNSFNPSDQSTTTYPTNLITMPSRSPPTTPHSNVDHPHLIYHSPLSDSPKQSIVTIPDSPTHQDKNIQTSTEQIIIQNVSIQTLPNPPLTLQQREPPNLPTLLQLRDLL